MPETITAEEFQKRYGKATSSGDQPETISADEFQKRYGQQNDSSDKGFLRQVGETALKPLMWLGEKSDKYIERPFRSAVGKLQEDVTDVPGALQAASSQYGDAPQPAPSYKQIYQKAGVSEPWADLAGTYTELFSPASAAAGFGVGKVAQGLLSGGQMASRVAAPAISAVKETVAPAIQKAKDIEAGFIGTIGETATGVPRQATKTYMTNYKDVENLIKKYGDDVVAASDDVRGQAQAAIQNTRRGLNAQISKTLSEASTEKNIDISGITSKLKTLKEEINPKLFPEEYKAVDSYIQSIKNVSGKTDKVNLQELQEIRQFLDGNASYNPKSIFPPGSLAEKAAKQGANVARKTINEAAPEIKKTNNALSALHKIEDKINKNVIMPGGPEGALLSAGAGTNPRQAQKLGLLQKQTGAPLLDQAKALAAQKEFAKPALLPKDVTGKAVARQLSAGAIGGLLGGPVAGVVASLAASPATLKKAIQARQILPEMIGAVMGSPFKMTGKSLEKASKFLSTPEGQQKLMLLMGVGRKLGDKENAGP